MTRRRIQGAGALLVAGALAVGLPWLLTRLADPAAVERGVAGLYDLIGLDGQAHALLANGMTATTRKLLTAAVAVVAAVAGMWALYAFAHMALERLASSRWHRRLTPWLFLAPAILLVSAYLVFPAVLTVWTSLTEDGGFSQTYGYALSDPAMLRAFRNNILWLVLGTAGSVGIGLAFAALMDRVRRESLAKTFIFLPLAISFVGASVIWRFVYAWRPPVQPQIGILNAVVVAAGGEPVPWVQTPPVGTLALIVIMVWLMTGFAMVVLSAAIKAVPTDVLEAARIDGASELQVFFRVVLPMIKGTVLTVATTVVIAVLKVFDIVYVMTGGQHDTDVVANRMVQELFRFRNDGRASAIAVVLLLVVLPAAVVNVRRLRELA